MITYPNTFVLNVGMCINTDIIYYVIIGSVEQHQNYVVLFVRIVPIETIV